MQVVALLAEHEALEPPPEPLQVQFQGPEPVTALADPVEQRLAVGAELTVVPLAEPHAPLTATTLLAEQVAVDPVGVPEPAHCQRQAEPVSLYSANVPALHPLEVLEAGCEA